MRKTKNPHLITDEDKVVCKVCGKEMSWIQNSHLSKHGITLAEYQERYPGSPTKTTKLVNKIKDTRGFVERPTCSREGCNNLVAESHNKYCSRRCSSKVQAETGHFKNFTVGDMNPSRTDGKHSHGKGQKKLAFERDEGCCQRCHKQLDGKQSKYGVHHLIPRRTFADYKDADILENLVTLCSKCHKDVETELVDHLIRLYQDRIFLDTTDLMQYLRDKI